MVGGSSEVVVRMEYLCECFDIVYASDPLRMLHGIRIILDQGLRIGLHYAGID